MEETTDFTIRSTSRLLAEELQRLSPAKKVIASHRAIYGDEGDFIDIGHVPVVRLASEILRKRNGWSRADAVEMAFDHLLSAGNGRKWQRAGEVTLNKYEGVARAFCLHREE